MTYFLIFVANFVFVLLKVVQQRNVVGDHYIWVTPISFMMSAAQVVIIIYVAQAQDWWSIIPMGLGGALGGLLGMLFHKRFIGNGNRNTQHKV